MILDDLLARRLCILSGKGGVGKSVVGAALAVAARKRGLRVLLVEIEAPLEAARYLGVPPVGADVREVAPGLSLVNLDASRTMEEYVRETVKLDMFVRRILDSPVYQRFYAVAPGLPELMMLGKIRKLVDAVEPRTRRPLYDLVVVDAPATGHGLTFLKVPLQASLAIPVGPVGHHARAILGMLRDPQQTALVVVAIPEEMAVVEAVEFARSTEDEVGIAPVAVVLNACHERRLSQAQEAAVLDLGARHATGTLAPGIDVASALDAARRHVRRRKRTAFYRTRLRRALSLPLVTLPFVFDESLGPDALEVLARRLEAA